MTERQFKTITKKLHFYNQGGIKKLCTMTETTLRQVMEEAAGVTQVYIRKLVQHDVDQQNKIALLSAKVYKLEKENAELKTDYEVLSCSVGDFGELQDRLEEEQRKNNGLEEQLTKAKEIIRDFISVAIDYIDPIDKNYSLIADSEQFLSEVEK